MTGSTSVTRWTKWIPPTSATVGRSSSGADDSTILTGASRIILTPVDAGTLDENVVTWSAAGDVDVFMQTGTIKTTETVTVLD